jgi:hypothetical protein
MYAGGVELKADSITSINSPNLSRGICSINGHKVDLEEFSENCRKRGGHTKSSNLALAPPYFLLLQANLNSVNTNTASKSTLSSFLDASQPAPASASRLNTKDVNIPELQSQPCLDITNS